MILLHVQAQLSIKPQYFNTIIENHLYTNKIIPVTWLIWLAINVNKHYYIVLLFIN